MCTANACGTFLHTEHSAVTTKAILVNEPTWRTGHE
jgi:hypothetical protein